MRDRGDYYKQYAARRRQIDRERRATPEGKARQLQIRLARIEAENEGGDVCEVGWGDQFIEDVGMDGGQGEAGAVVTEAKAAAGTGSGTRVEEGALVSGAQGRILEWLC